MHPDDLIAFAAAVAFLLVAIFSVTAVLKILELLG